MTIDSDKPYFKYDVWWNQKFKWATRQKSFYFFFTVFKRALKDLKSSNTFQSKEHYSGVGQGSSKT